MDFLWHVRVTVFVCFVFHEGSIFAYAENTLKGFTQYFGDHFGVGSPLLPPPPSWHHTR